MGMGRYQWSIFVLCGFGYMLDLLWAQAFGLIATPLQQELGFSDDELGNIFSSFSAGLTAGAFVWGVLVDIVGRWWAFNFTVLCSCIFGLFLGVPSDYNSVLVLTAFVGFGVGGNIPIDTTITLEFLPQNRRYLLAALSVFQPVGVILCSAIAYGLIPFHSCGLDLPSCKKVAAGVACCNKSSNYGWRYLLFTLGSVTLLIFLLRFVVFRFQESPKYLLYRGRDADAVKVLQYIASYNKRECTTSLETFEALSNDDSSTGTAGSSGLMLGSGAEQTKSSLSEKLKLEFTRFQILFDGWTMVRLTLLIWIIYAFDYWSFSIAGSFLPTIIARKGRKLGLSLEDSYRSYVGCITCTLSATEPLLARGIQNYLLTKPFPGLHLPLRHPRRPPRRPHVQGPPSRHGPLLRPARRLPLHLRRRQDPAAVHRHQRARVLLPIHVQRRPLRLDARAIPSPDPWHRGRRGELLGPHLQYRRSPDCGEGLGDEP